MLKLLGATRARILMAQAIEFLALALIVATLAFGLGAGAGWYVVVEVLELEWGPDWSVVTLTLVAGALVTLVLGLLGPLPALAARPARALRTLYVGPTPSYFAISSATGATAAPTYANGLDAGTRPNNDRTPLTPNTPQIGTG